MAVPRPLPTLAALATAAGLLAACQSHDGERADRRAERRAVREAAREAAALAVRDDGETGHADGAHADGAHADGAHADGAHADGHDAHERDSARGRSPRVRLSAENGTLTRDPEPTLGPGDVRVASTDGKLILTLAGGAVRMRLGDSAVARVRSEMTRKADTSSGFGGFVARTVTGAMAGAMGEVTRFTLRVPLHEIRDMHYRQGELTLRTGDEHSGTSAHFAPDDAERFMAAVRARQRELGTRPAGG